MNHNQPPSSQSTLVVIGQNSRGQWVAQQQHGLFGGLFASRIGALRYALFENGYHPEAIVEIAQLELDMTVSPFAAPAIAPVQQRNAA